MRLLSASTKMPFPDLLKSMPDILRRHLLALMAFLAGFTSLTIAQNCEQIGLEVEPLMNIEELVSRREVLEYRVKYGFFTLGTVTVETGLDTLIGGEKMLYMRATARSNPKLPFVGEREERFHSIAALNDTMAYEVQYWSDDVDSEKWREFYYSFDYENLLVYRFMEGQPLDTLELNGPSVAGPVNIQIGRFIAGTGKKWQLDLVEDEGLASVEYNNPTDVVERKSAAFPGRRLKAFFADGKANFEGPFGFNGKFKGWYTADKLRIPLGGQLKVWLGNVKISLQSYTVIDDE